MTILGITFTHDGTLTVLRDGAHVFSIAEERLTRRKGNLGFPFQALRYVVHTGIITPSEVAAVAISTGVFRKEWARTFALELTEEKRYYDFQNDKQPADFFIADEEWRSVDSDDACRAYVEKKLVAILSSVGITAPLHFYDHHACHAVGAYVGAGRNETLVITLDGEGDEKSGTISIGRAGSLTPVMHMETDRSIGWLYSEMTRHAGFKTSRHEGKITGLAAYGSFEKGWNIIKNSVRLERGRFWFSESTPFARIMMRVKAKLGIEPYAVNHWRTLIFRIAHLSREDMAATVQHALEERVVEFVRYWVRHTGISHVAAAGGVFANVKLNQRIAELPEVESLFIYPNMGDGGNAYGAALFAHHTLTHTPLSPERVHDVYLGPEYSSEEIETALAAHPELSWKKSEDIAKECASLIHNKKVVGWFQGRMEYGPRALGNRSVVAHPTDATINKWLNDRMKRTEFMPFAPSCLYERAGEIFSIPKESLRFPAEFMTITFDMHAAWAQRAPAVAHVDGTARPQLVRAETNPRYHALISEYERLSGLPLVINTSFNVHEEPIVCSPEDAIQSLLMGMVDVLAIGDYLVTHPRT